MKRINRMIGTILFTTLLILISALGVSGTVLSQRSGMSREMQEYYRHAEHEYVKEIRTFLAQQGYSDSGVTMNRIINEDESVDYVVTIHHRKISALEETQKDALLASCKEIEFPVENCGFYHKFLESDF